MDKEILSGTIESVVHRNEENGYTVLQASTPAGDVSVVGKMPEPVAGASFEATGRWENHPSYGTQFKVETLEIALPQTSAAMLKYLQSRVIRGIGPKTAAKIVAYFGDETFNVIENDPKRLTSISGISLKKAKDISNQFKEKNGAREIVARLGAFGLTISEGTELYKSCGLNSVDVVKRNPYILCQTLKNFSYTRAREIESLLGEGEIKPEYRIQAGVLEIVRHNLNRNSYTCVPRKGVVPLAVKLTDCTEEEIGEQIDNMLNIRMLVSEEINGNEFLFLPEIWLEEKQISQRLRLLAKHDPPFDANIDAEIEKIERINNIKYDYNQKTAIKAAARGAVTVITGGPGTGKTTTVKGIILYFERRGCSICLAAPTGRAAKRMTQLTGWDAKTIHRLLEVEFDGRDEMTFKMNANNPLPYDVIILDEVSMVDTQLFNAFLSAVKYGSRIILVGDADQLPSVGPGCVLKDIISSGVVTTVRLKKIFRQAYESLIVLNAHRVIEGRPAKLDEKKGDFFFLQREFGHDAADTICDLVKRRLPNAYGYSPIGDIQTLCPTKKGECGTFALNERLQLLLNPPSEDKAELAFGRILFREGDKVMQTSNDYLMQWSKGDTVGTGIFNGDVGFIERIDTRNGEMIIEFDEEKIVRYPFASLESLELAYAVTVHKSQGSEYPVVVMPVVNVPPQLRYRNLLYTAITRAKKLMVLVGSRECVNEMIENDKQNRRYTGLEHFLLLTE